MRTPSAQGRRPQAEVVEEAHLRRPADPIRTHPYQPQQPSGNDELQ
jgi:hypothetical protein